MQIDKARWNAEEDAGWNGESSVPKDSMEQIYQP